MQTVTMSYRGKDYTLGQILPITLENSLRYLIVPNFPFRPPFIVLRLHAAQMRLYTLGRTHLDDGGQIDKMPLPAVNIVLQSHYHFEV